MTLALIISVTLALLFSLVSSITMKNRKENVAMLTKTGATTEKQLNKILKLSSYYHHGLHIQTICILYIAFMIFSGN